MPVLHRRDDDSGFYLRGRIDGSWITWQVTREGEQWLKESGFHDGESLDRELLEMFLDKGWLYTGGSGAGVALDAARPSFIRVGEGVKHPTFGIGEIKELLKDGTCRVVFFREYPRTRDVPVDQLSAARSIELARERSAAYNRALRLTATPKAVAVEPAPGGLADEGASQIGRSSPTPVHTQSPRPSGCLSVLADVLLLLVLVEILSII